MFRIGVATLRNFRKGQRVSNGKLFGPYLPVFLAIAVGCARSGIDGEYLRDGAAGTTRSTIHISGDLFTWYMYPNGDDPVLLGKAHFTLKGDLLELGEPTELGSAAREAPPIDGDVQVYHFKDQSGEGLRLESSSLPTMYFIKQ